MECGVRAISSFRSEAIARGTRMLRTALGPLIAAHLEDPSVVEIMLNPDGRLWIDRLCGGLEDTGCRIAPSDAERIVRLVAHHVGSEVHAGMPRVSAELPESGERFEGLVPPVVAAPCFAIRRPAIAVFSLDDYVEAGIMSCAQANLLRRAVQDRRNILVAGGTSTGKTTLINALLAEVAFLNGNVDRRTVSGERIDAPVSPYVLQAGAVIPAALLTGLRSDLPGQVTAQVTEDVYDRPTGSTRLIPQGARLVGQYDAQIAFGQTRALLVWTRLIMPNGRSIVLERQPGADAEGYAGLEDEVDNHWGTLFKAAILSTLLSIGSEVGSSGSEDDLIRAIRRGGSDSVNQIGQRIVGRSLNVQPTITIRPGFPVRVLITRDLVLEPYRD